jgi:hypothetical protein
MQLLKLFSEVIRISSIKSQDERESFLEPGSAKVAECI